MAMKIYQDPAGEWLSEADITALLAERFPVEAGSRRQRRISYYDSFDWRLYRKSLALIQSGQQWELVDLNAGETVLAKAAHRGAARFAEDFPESDLKVRLGKILEMRALLQLCEVRIEEEHFRVLDGRQKTVARVIRTRMAAGPDEAGCFLRISPLRGYQAAAREVEVLLEEKQLAHRETSMYQLALKLSGKQPGDYSSKFAIELPPELPAAAALQRILRELREVMQQNEPGVIADIDSEFLHDFRVAVRRTRSALGQLKGVFAAERLAQFRSDFAEIGKATNLLRDLDVYLLDRRHYEAMLPETLQGALAPLFTHLEAERGKALRQVTDMLRSRRYARQMARWEAFLAQEAGSAPGPDAGRPVIELARERIRQRYQRILKRGGKINQRSPDAKLHRLRIDCKKLRYLLEFFNSLFPGEKMSRLIKQLKKLQNHLGRFQDICVQEEALLAFAGAMPGGSDDSDRTTLLAIGCLVGMLHQQKQEVRSHFAETFEDFATAENGELWAHRA